MGWIRHRLGTALSLHAWLGGGQDRRKVESPKTHIRFFFTGMSSGGGGDKEEELVLALDASYTRFFPLIFCKSQECGVGVERTWRV